MEEREERSVEQQLARVSDPARQPSMTDMRGLSDLSREEGREFWRHWRVIPLERRRALLAAMQELAEENAELDFREIFLCCLADDDLAVRTGAVQGLWEDDRSSTLRRLLDLLRSDPSQEVRAAAALSLSRFAYRAATAELDQALGQQLLEALLQVHGQSGEPVEVRRRALEALGYYSDDPDVIAAITAAYASDDGLWQQSALLAMGRSMAARWIPSISAAMASPQPPLRYEAAHACGEFAEQGRALVPALLPLIEDHDMEVAQAALWALGQIGGQQAREALKRAARHSDPARKQAAEEALEELDFYDKPLFGELD